MKNSKNVLISGYYGFANFGDETILSILSQKLKDLECNVCALSSNPKVTSELYNINSIHSFDLKNAFLAILKSDILFSGGGSLLQDVTSLKSLIYYLIIINLALIFNKKVIIFAQGIGPINNKFGAFLTKHTLKRCTYLCVRDRKSRLLLKKWNTQVDLVCDPIFDLPIPEYQPTNTIGIQLRSFKTLTSDYIEKLARFVNEKFSDKKIQIFSFQDSLDLKACNKFEIILKNLNPQINTEIISNASSQEILDKFSKLQYLIAMRFHANLIALKFGIKTLALSYDIKVEKLAEEANLPYLSMQNDDNFETVYQELINQNTNNLVDFAASKKFEWKKIEDIIS